MIFDLMIVLATNKSIMRSKLEIMLFGVLISWSECLSPDQHCQILMNKFDLMNKNNFDLMKKWISISWNLTSWSMPLAQGQEVEFHEIKIQNIWNIYMIFHFSINKLWLSVCSSIVFKLCLHSTYNCDKVVNYKNDFIFSFVKSFRFECFVDVSVIVLENWNCSRDSNPRMSDVVLEEVGPDQLLVSWHPDRNYLVDELTRNTFKFQSN